PVPAVAEAARTAPEPLRRVPAPSAADEERVPMSAIRRRIAERLVHAQRTAAILTTFNEVDMSAVQALRARYKDRFRDRYGVGLGFMSFFARATIAALREVPTLNAEIRGDDVVYKRFVHLGVAVATERGLVVPVVHDAHRLSFAEIEREIERLAARAREGKLALEDLSGGTFTLTNGGIFGSLLSTPILNPPQSAACASPASRRTRRSAARASTSAASRRRRSSTRASSTTRRATGLRPTASRWALSSWISRP